MDTLDDQSARYIGMIDQASTQLGELLDELGLAARIESGRYEPSLREIDTAALAEHARTHLGEERVGVAGSGAPVLVDVEATKRAFSSLVQCSLRHGGLERVDVEVDGPRLRVAPITPASEPVVLGRELRDLGAATAVRLVAALGGSVGVREGILTVELPASS
jgi:signal transduction histidine kinase